jgi:4-hydroxybenzoate polyprenyltransferase
MNVSWNTIARLVRLPNLPSALSNICLGALATNALPDRWLPFLALLLASACLYSGGMVFNDYFDRDEDKRDRPNRPIPSGQITSTLAAWFGTGLLLAGVASSALAGWLLSLREDGSSSILPVVLAIALVLAILAYDGALKTSPVAPGLMGLCRFLNVLLGISICGHLAWPRGTLLALVVGVYVTGVTLFARTEARLSNQTVLRVAAGILLAALVLALPVPALLRPGTSSPLFPYLLALFGFSLGLAVWTAQASPTPSHVQAAVKRSLLGLIVLDAILASAVAGSVGLLLLGLLAPAFYLNRRRTLYAT